MAEVTLALAIFRAGLRLGPALCAQPVTPRTQDVSSSVWSTHGLVFSGLAHGSSQGSRMHALVMALELHHLNRLVPARFGDDAEAPSAVDPVVSLEVGKDRSVGYGG